MARYRYSSLTAGGRARRGLVEPITLDDAVRVLGARGETAIRLRVARANEGRARISRAELATFLADLAALHEAGVPLRRALDVLSGGASTPKAAELAQLM